MTRTAARRRRWRLTASIAVTAVMGLVAGTAGESSASSPALAATSASATPSLSFANPDSQSLFGTAYSEALTNLMVTNTVNGSSFDQTGLLTGTPPKIIKAGGGYGQPWTRDSSVNTWNAGSLLAPDVAANTLWAVVTRQPNGQLIVQQDNQWWDQVIWVTAAWNHYLTTGDKTFLADAYQASINTLTTREATNFNDRYRLFQGPAFMNDGIAGYPTPPADTGETHGSFVLDYPHAQDEMTLSTNALYYAAYVNAAQMARALHQPAVVSAQLQAKANRLKASINRSFWIPGKGLYGYLLHNNDGLQGQLDQSEEGSGLSFAVLFGIANPSQTRSIMAHAHPQTWGITDVYPNFARYSDATPGRHNEIVWPMIQGYWASAAAKSGAQDVFATEVARLAKLADNNSGFFEIYDAHTGMINGGYQNGHQWASEPDQTWSATAYLRMIYGGVFGIDTGEFGMSFHPTLPAGWGTVTLNGLRYRDATLTATLHGAGNVITSFLVDGARQPTHSLPTTLTGNHTVDITLSGAPTSDRDGDGVPDAQDNCPDTAGAAALAGCPDPQRLEAEDAINTGGTKANNNHTGFTGRGFVDGIWQVGAASTFTVHRLASQTGSATLLIRYSNGDTSVKTMSLYVDGTKVEQLSLPPTGSWADWSTLTVPGVPLTGTRSTVTIGYGATDTGRANLDWIGVQPTV